MNKIIYCLCLALIFFGGVFLRYFDLGSPSMWIDEGYSSFVSFIASQSHFIPYLPSGRYEFGSYAFTLLQSLSFWLIGYTDFAARLPSFFFGGLNMILVFFFAHALLQERKYKNLGVVCIMFLFSFSTWQIVWSREARFYEMLSFFYLFGSYLLYKYILQPQTKYIIYFFVVSFFGLVFHPFYFALFGVGVLILAWNIGEKYFHHKTFDGLKYLLLPMLCFAGYILAQTLFKYISGTSLLVSDIIPHSASLGEDYKKAYTLFYLKNIFSQLGIIFWAYLGGIIYFSWNKKWKELLLFGLLVAINFYALTQKGLVAHSRYVFHMYGIITLIGGYITFIFFEYWYTKFSPSRLKKGFVAVGILFVLGGIFSTYQFTFFPQKIYYLDVTSPKPNFKLAYQALDEKKDLKIVSGFPQLCYWYNLKKPRVCEYALAINLTGSQERLASLQEEAFHNYTKTPYLKKMSQIESEKYYFVLDDLTMKNAVNRDIIDYIKQNCTIIYSDLGNGESENFIGIWKCYQ